MTKQSDNGTNGVPPSYLGSIQGMADREDNRLSSLKDDYHLVRELLLANSQRSEGNGIILRLSSGLRDILVDIQTVHYGYVANWTGQDWPDILEQIENDLDTRSVPWRADWRRKKANRQPLDV